MIGFKISNQFFSQWDAKPKPILTYTRDLSRALSKLQVIAKNSDSFIALFAPVMFGGVITLQLLCSLSSSRNGKIFKSCKNISQALMVSFVIADTIQKINSHLDARRDRSV